MERFIEHIQKKFLVARIFDFTGELDQHGKKIYKIRVWRHGIKNNTHYVQKCGRDAKRNFPNAEYIDFYDKVSSVYQFRLSL